VRLAGAPSRSTLHASGDVMLVTGIDRDRNYGSWDPNRNKRHAPTAGQAISAHGV